MAITAPINQEKTTGYVGGPFYGHATFVLDKDAGLRSDLLIFVSEEAMRTGKRALSLGLPAITIPAVMQGEDGKPQLNPMWPVILSMSPYQTLAYIYSIWKQMPELAGAEDIFEPGQTIPEFPEGLPSGVQQPAKPEPIVA